MRFKKAAAVILTSIMTLSLAACSGNGNDSKTESGDDAAKTSDSKNVELSVSIWDPNQEPGIKEILGDFTAKTGIKTKLSVIKWEEY